MLRHQVEGNAAGLTIGQRSDVGIFIRPSRRPLNLEGLLRRVNRAHSKLIDEVSLDFRDRRSRPERVGKGGTVELDGHLDLPATVVMDTMTLLERERLAMNLEDFELSVFFEENDRIIDDAAAPPKLFGENKYRRSLREPYEIGFATLSLDENINFCSHGISPFWAQFPRAPCGFTMYCSSGGPFGQTL
jgi:hypothetical protein